VTVHDLIHLTYGGTREKLYYRAILKPFIRRAKCVLTVSEASKREIATWAGVEPARIEVAYNAIESAGKSNDEETRRILAERGLEKGKYFLALSNSKPHKNLPMLLKAYEAFRSQRTGGEIWPLAITAKGLGRGPGVIELESLDGKSVNAVLSAAGALFYPSLTEGFGRPPLEAAAQGVPVVLSRIAPHEEALSDFQPSEALWVAPSDFHGWVNAFHRASRGEIAPASPETQARFLEKFSEERLARHMDRVYRRVLGLAP
jgi:glycosyltransferase involved in cell wall biosynthesis